MSKSNNNKHEQLIISESENRNPHHRTTQARSQLYDLVAKFRKTAETADDVRTRTIFEFAAEIISGLVRAFRRHEDQIDQQDKKKTE